MTRLYTEDEIESAFNMYDTSGDGKIERDEFIKFLSTIFPGFKEELASAWYDEVDKDHSGYLDLQEFICVVREIERETNKENMFISLWNVFDEDKNGVLDKNEFSKMWKSLITNMSNETLEQFFNVFDDDGNGELSYIEFMDIASIIDLEICEKSEEKNEN